MLSKCPSVGGNLLHFRAFRAEVAGRSRAVSGKRLQGRSRTATPQRAGSIFNLRGDGGILYRIVASSVILKYIRSQVCAFHIANTNLAGGAECFFV